MRNPLSLEAFADWLKMQDPANKYDFMDIQKCIVCQYLDFLGIKYMSVGGYHWTDEDMNEHPLPRGIEDVASSAENFPSTTSTFGAAYARAQALMAKEKVGA